MGGWDECGQGPKKHSGAIADTPDYGATYTPAQQKADEARAKEEAAKQRAIAIAKELGKIIADELGITDALDCFTTGSLGACGATAANVVTSLIGGGPVGKLVSKYWYRADKAYALGKRIVGLGKKLWAGFKDWQKGHKAAKEAAKAAEECNSFTTVWRRPVWRPEWGTGPRARAASVVGHPGGGVGSPVGVRRAGLPDGHGAP
ncbi:MULTISPECIES: hypothetical protein [Streptomyces]|uniref:hypothetical protein n=1 Tax=Streptomyces TaxID=1883 RepID=UPI001F0C5394|nr:MULTISPECIES: hypothetical protein [Streptomyces]